MKHQTNRYEFFDHTADVGIRASGRTCEQLFVRMAQGLIELLVEDSPIELRQTQEISLVADNIELLLHAWLSELLYNFSTARRFLPGEYDLNTVTKTVVHGKMLGESFDPTRHAQGREVKAITRHMLEVRERSGLWYGQVIVDI